MTFPWYTSARAIRNKRYDEQRGLCYYCNVPMIKTGDGRKSQPHNLCTLEHLVDRLSPFRWDDNIDSSSRRYVAACARCNHTRSAWNMKHTPKELITLLSHKPKGVTARSIVLEFYKTHHYVEPPPFRPSWEHETA